MNRHVWIVAIVLVSANSLAARADVGTIVFPGDLVLGDGMVYAWGLAPNDWDRVIVDGDITAEDRWTLIVRDFGGIPNPSALYDIFRFSGNGDLGNWAIATDSGWDVSNASIGIAPLNATYQMVYLTGVVVPEPGAWAMLAFAAMTLGMVFPRRRRRL